MKDFRVLNASEVVARISAICTYKKQSTETKYLVHLCLYKKPFVDEAVLNETVGFMNYSLEPIANPDESKPAGCKIIIYDKERNQPPVTRYGYPKAGDATEKNPIHIAGFSCGIGTELYTAPKITFFDDEINIKETDDGPKCYDHFVIQDFQVKNQDGYKFITKLSILNEETNTLKQWVSDDGIQDLRKPTSKKISDGSKKNPVNAASADTTPKASKKATPSADEKAASATQVRYLQNLCTKHQIKEDSICAKYKVDSLKNLSASQASAEISTITTKRS